MLGPLCGLREWGRLPSTQLYIRRRSLPVAGRTVKARRHVPGRLARLRAVVVRLSIFGRVCGPLGEAATAQCPEGRQRIAPREDPAFGPALVADATCGDCSAFGALESQSQQPRAAAHHERVGVLAPRIRAEAVVASQKRRHIHDPSSGPQRE
eukprot:scaffold17805_cov116-Isochrysis_galbana.AAC.2